MEKEKKAYIPLHIYKIQMRTKEFASSLPGTGSGSGNSGDIFSSGDVGSNYMRTQINDIWDDVSE